MVRRQIQFTPGQNRMLQTLAETRAMSVAALVREAVDRLLRASGRDRKWERLWEVVGTCHDPAGAGDVALKHDEYLSEIHGRDNDPR